jgi:glycosyltransferase involved in cell wall biosynthesis
MPILSVVIAFFNMQREAERTLYSLTTAYQKGVSEVDYEVLVFDSNSDKPLDPDWVRSMQGNFYYRYIESDWPTPCRALNTGIGMARADTVVCMIDGARILSPGVLPKMIQANRLFDNGLVQTIAMHIGSESQNQAVENGYNQGLEDKLFNTIDWKRDGYRLFDISCLAPSSRNGFFGALPESNCFSIKKEALLEIGGFDERFHSRGGGLANHRVLQQLLKNPSTQPLTLLGEATFHQFHGGVATNVASSKHPMKEFLNEYNEIFGEAYRFEGRNPIYFGGLTKNTIKYAVTNSE